MTVNNKFRSFIFWVYLFLLVVIYLKEHNEDKSFSSCRIEYDLVDILLLNY
jgi:hypothetical protein